MPLVIPDGFSQVEYRWSLTGDPEVMVHTCGIDNGVIVGDLIGAGLLNSDFLNAWPVGNQASVYTYLGVVLRVGNASGPPTIFEVPASRVGGNASVSPPAQNTCLLVRKQSSQGGRAGRGRMYMPPFMFDEASISPAGVINSAPVNQIQGFIDAWFHRNDAYVILHSEGSTLPPSPIGSFIVDPIVATQRRRLRR